MQRQKYALVTGGSGGIGAEIAHRLSAEGWTVAIGYYKQEQTALALAEEIGGIALCADFSDPQQAAALADRAADAFGRLDLLVNNAGISVTGLFQELSQAETDRLYTINLLSAVACTRSAVRHMLRAHNGCILNISSIWGEAGGACETDYSVTKAGLIGLTKALARELGPSGIRVNCISPGVIDTPMNGNLSADTIESLKNETALCRIGTPADIADAVCFLASQQASFITGQVLRIDGGLL